MMARLSLITLISTLLFIQSAVALPFGWFKKPSFPFSNGTAPAFPTGGPTGTGFAVPTGFFDKEKRFPFPTGTGFPIPTGFPTSFPTGFVKREAEAEAVEAVEADIVNKRFEGARKERRFWFPFPGGPAFPAPSAPSSGFPFPTATGFPTGYPTGGPTAFPTGYYA